MRVCSKGQQHQKLNSEVIVSEFSIFSPRAEMLFDMKLNLEEKQNVKCEQTGISLNQEPICRLK